MNDGLTIRPGTPEHLEQVIALAEGAENAAHWRPESYAQIFQSPRTLIVAESAGAIVGFVIAHNIAGEWELENIAVSQAYRRRGIGQRLVKALVSDARIRGAQNVFLEVRESNLGARRLYERCGFGQYGCRKSYYSNPSEDGLLYRFLCSPETLENG